MSDEVINKLEHCVPYLRLATFISRSLLYDLLMETDTDAVHTMRAVMLLGRAYSSQYAPLNEETVLMFTNKLMEYMASVPISKEKEIKDMLKLNDFREFITIGMKFLGIY